MLTSGFAAHALGKIIWLRGGFVAALAIAPLVLLTQPAIAAISAPTRYVSIAGSDSNPSSNTCTSSGSPCRTIQRAVNVATNGEEIAVAAGTYAENVSVIGKNLTIRGGWDAGFNTRNPSSNVTVIDGQNLNTAICFTGSQSTVDGFTITNGYASLSGVADDHTYSCGSPSSHGGGVLVRSNSNVTIANNTVINNTANRRGGGIFVVDSVASINSNKVYSNTAKQGAGIWGGGAMDNINLSNKLISISGNEIAYNKTVTNTDNSVTFDSDGGGLLLNFGSLSQVLNNQIYSNTILAPDGYGAALRVQFGSTSVISGNQILSNTTYINPLNQFSSTLGGGMELVEASAQIINNRWENNASVAIKVDNAPYAIIEGNTIVKNRSDRGGAGIWIIRQTVFTITNNIIADNIANGSADGGGGINLGEIGQNGVGSGLIANNLIYNNRATGHGGGGIGMVGMPGPLVIRNNQIYGNQARDGAGMAIEDAQNVIVNSNLIYGNTSSSATAGVYIRGGTSATTSVISLLNNFIYKNDDYGVNAQNTGGFTLTNNTLVNNAGVGISAYPAVGGQNIRLVNNIVSHHGGCALTNGPYTLTNNLFFFNGGSGCTATTGLTSNPLYVSFATDDFRLSNGSPALDTGTSIGAPSTDYFGSPRPQGSGIDIGAHEFNVSQQAQTITFNPNPLPDRPATNAPFVVNASASSGLAIAFASSGVCSVAPVNNTQATVTLSGIAGSCTITTTQPGNGSYTAATPVARPFQVTLVAQSISFGPIADKLAGDVFLITPTASSGLVVNLTSSGACSVTGNQVIVGAVAGTCSLSATQTGNATYSAAGLVTRSFSVRQTQTISFTPTATMFTTDAPSPLVATASSGLGVTFSSLDTGICTVSGSTLTLTRVAGACRVVAAQAGNGNFVAAPSVTRTLSIVKQSQLINLDPISDKLVTDQPFDVVVNTTSNLSVTLTLSGDCSISARTVTLLGVAGECTVTAHQSGDATYLAAVTVSRTFLIQAISQAITLEPIPNKLITDLPFTVVATASSGLPVSFQASGVCEIFGDQIVLQQITGVCTITATQAGNSMYAPAGLVTIDFAVINILKQTQSITIQPVLDIFVGIGPIQLFASASSNLPVSYATRTPAVCSISGAIVTPVGPGTCKLDVTQAGDTNYNPATPVVIEFVVRLAKNKLFLPSLFA